MCYELHPELQRKISHSSYNSSPQPLLDDIQLNDRTTAKFIKKDTRQNMTPHLSDYLYVQAIKFVCSRL